MDVSQKYGVEGDVGRKTFVWNEWQEADRSYSKTVHVRTPGPDYTGS